MNRKSVIFAAVIVGAGCVLALTAQAQNTSPPSDLGAEPGNWGLTPFAAIPTIALRPEDRVAIRALEDQHIKERRVFEDKYEAELRALVRKQAEEREALRARLSKTR